MPGPHRKITFLVLRIIKNQIHEEVVANKYLPKRKRLRIYSLIVPLKLLLTINLNSQNKIYLGQPIHKLNAWIFPNLQNSSSKLFLLVTDVKPFF